VLTGLSHENIVNVLGYGSEGTIVKKSGRKYKGLTYLLLDYVEGDLLFNMVESMGPMGEDVGRFFMLQMLDILSYLGQKGVSHRDIKLENILLDTEMNLKLADFGFATFHNIDKLKSYRGTKSYMAPEIKDNRTYNGK